MAEELRLIKCAFKLFIFSLNKFKYKILIFCHMKSLHGNTMITDNSVL